MANIVTDLQRGTAGINSIEDTLKDLQVIGSHEEVPIEQFPERIRQAGMDKTNLQTLSGSVADEFNDQTDYDKGDQVMHNYQLYEFTQDHTAGAWNTGHVKIVSVEDMIKIKGVTIDGEKCIFS